MSTVDQDPWGATRSPQPTELLVIWAATREAARAVAWTLQLNMRQVFAVGNRSADSLRGVSPTAVLVIPGADSADVDAALHTACAAAAGGRGVPFLDLRAVQL